MNHRRNLWSISIGLAALVVLAVQAAAGPFEEGVDAYNRGEYTRAYRLWLPLAERGNAHAQFKVGLLYYTGEGVPQDYHQAARWCCLAADQGYAQAQSELGALYAEGQGVPQDYQQAARWYRLAADQGYAKAQLGLGVLYGLGQGVPKDSVQAHMWFNLAAAQGDPLAPQLRDLLEKEMTSSERAEAQRLAQLTHTAQETSASA